MLLASVHIRWLTLVLGRRRQMDPRPAGLPDRTISRLLIIRVMRVQEALRGRVR